MKAMKMKRVVEVFTHIDSVPGDAVHLWTEMREIRNLSDDAKTQRLIHGDELPEVAVHYYEVDEEAFRFMLSRGFLNKTAAEKVLDLDRLIREANTANQPKA